MKKLVRLRVLKEHFVLDGIDLPKGDYDGEMSWNDQIIARLLLREAEGLIGDTASSGGTAK